MTRPELPAQATNVLRAIGSTATCTSTQAESLKLLLLPAAPTVLKKLTEKSLARQKNKKLPAAPSKTANSRDKKQPAITVHECVEESHDTLKPQDRLVLATEIVNVTLKALTITIKTTRTPQTPRPKRRSLARSSSSASLSGAATPIRCQTPLQPISVNRVLQSPAKAEHSIRSSSGSSHDFNGARTQAECARIGLACLRYLQTLENLSAKFAPLQLETAMSALVAKLLALGYDDLALKELRILKRRIETLASGQGKAGTNGSGNAKKTPYEEEGPLPKEPLSGLLRYTATSLSGPLLALAVTSQIQALKILALKGHGPSIEAALERLRMDVGYAPANLIERQIDLKNQKTNTNAAHQLETLAQTLTRFCPNASKAADESSKTRSSVSAQAAFELQVLAFQARLRWWDLSNHQPNVETEMIEPLTRCLSAFQRRCKLESIAKYSIARDNCQVIMAALKKRGHCSKHNFITIFKIFTDMASEGHLNEEAIQWIKLGLETTEAVGGSASHRCVFLCQLATSRLRESGNDPDDKSVIESLRDAVTSLEGDLRGESAELDELLVAVANLRKSAFSIVQDNAFRFSPSEVLGEGSGHGQCIRFILLSVRFLIRYVGKEPPQDASESKVWRYNQRKELAARVASSVIDSIIAVSKLSVRSEMAVWSVFDTGLRDCLELAAVVDTDSLFTKECQKKSVGSLPRVSISQTYWFRFLALKSLRAESKSLGKPLQISIDILENRPNDEKVAGCLLAKLEKYAVFCETSQDYGRATKYYEEAIRFNIDVGVVHDLADAAAATPWPSVVAKARKFEQLCRPLLALPKAASKVKGSPLRTRIFFDPEWLPPDQRSLLLELQLSSIISILLSQGVSSIKCDDLNTLATTLILLYDKDSFPVRRLHVCVRLLHLLSVHPDILRNSLVSKALNEADKQPSPVAGCLDEALRPYAAHLSSCRNAYLGLRSNKSDSRYFETILADWCRLLQQCPDRQSLAEHVYDVPGWLQHLELLSDYLKVQGNETLRTAVLHLIVAVHEGASSTQCLDLALKLTNLGIHYTRLGYSGQGGVTLQKARRYLDVSDVPAQLLMKWSLTNAENTLLNGNLDECCEFLKQAREAFQSGLQSLRQSAKDRLAFAQSAADLMLIQSKFLVEKKHQGEALFFARASVQEFQRIWAFIERHTTSRRIKTSVDDVNNSLAEAVSDLSISSNQADTTSHSRYAALETSAYWDLSPRLFESLLHLSQCFVHYGLLPEAQYYLGQCQRIADAVHSPSMIHACLMLRGQYAICSGDVEGGLAILQTMEQTMSRFPLDHNNIKTGTVVALHYLKIGRIEAGSAVCSEAMHALRSLTLKSALDRLIYKPEAGESLNTQMNNLKMEEPNQVPTKKSKVAQKKAPTKSRMQSSVVAAPRIEESLAPDIIPLNILKGELLRNLALANLSQGALDVATLQLDNANALPHQQQSVIMHGLLSSKINLCRGFQQLVGDPVFSVLPESTICCPAAIVPSELKTTPKSPPKASKSAKTAPSKALSKNAILRHKATLENHSQHLSLAQRRLSEIFYIATASSSTSTVHTITETLSKTLTILSALPSTQIKGFCSSQFMAYILELGRRVAMNRELLSISIECQLSDKRDLDRWPEYKAHKNGLQLLQNHSFEFSTFQEDYINIIPKSWQVLSMTLSESHEEIWVSKIRAGQSPFILRLPFNRENTTDGDDEGFSFNEGKSEMIEIIQMANKSAQVAGEISRKGAKREWWDNRATFDTRLKDLLTNVESVWFGGFRSIFSPIVPEPDLLARFQQSLQNILDKHLPSRQTSGKSKQISRITLDSRVLELFVGLGAPGKDNDVDEQLMDLLYFVVDILQFNKERNAYDEIDFDAIVVETVDALRHYHQAVSASESNCDKQHTILILDRHLHGFPWESLPCMAGQPISRLPSLGCLRRRILEIREEREEKGISEALDGAHVNPDHGAYVLNPGGDLVNTQAMFEGPLQSLSNWESFVEREPSETDMKCCLQDNKLFLYFGHGSGKQYMRPRTIKKLEHCAVALLMGCSSGALTEAGEYEAYGTPIDYMHAGCPALLATLWDVTDKDIDRFSKEVLQKWGLFRERISAVTSSPVKKSVKQKEKMKVREKELVVESGDAVASLDEAVAKGRDSCFLRYLNGAAPVVYGVPVYLS